MTDDAKFEGFSQRWKDFPDYIIGITKEICEDRGVGTLNHYFSTDIPVRSPMGIERGNKNVIASTMATINEGKSTLVFKHATSTASCFPCDKVCNLGYLVAI